MEVRSDATSLRVRLHEVSAALVTLHVDILRALGDAEPGTTEAYELQSMLEAADALRDAMGEFIELVVAR